MNFVFNWFLVKGGHLEKHPYKNSQRGGHKIIEIPTTSKIFSV